MDKFVKLIQDVEVLWSKYHPMYLNGVKNTLILALVATVIGFLIGLVCGVLNTIPCAKHDPAPKRVFLKLVRGLIRVYVEVFRGTPMVLQAVFIFYGLPYFTDGAVAFRGNAGMWLASIIIVSINTGAYMAESVRGGIISVDPGQTEGAKAIGMTHVQTMLHVILPQAVRNILPAMCNEFVTIIKETSILGMVGIVELMFRAQSIAKQTYIFLEPYVIAAILYFIVVFPLSKIISAVERRMSKSVTR